LLEKFKSKSVVVNPRLTNIQICTIISNENEAFLNYLRVTNGAITYTKTTRVKKKLQEDEDVIIKHLMYSVGLFNEQKPSELLSNILLKDFPEDIKTFVPSIGDKRKLVEMSLKNALEFKKEHIALRSNLKGQAKETLVMLQQDLNLKALPRHIECFDNSNLQGTHPVASVVCFRNGIPSKKDYRHFNIKTVTGPDDFSSMREIVYRRYKRLTEEDMPLPDLVIIDGGKGQLSAATNALSELGIYGKLAIIGIAKKLEEIYFPEDSLPLHIQKKSPSLKIIQRARDEAHRFAITFHRKKRSKSAFASQLIDIAGVGGKTADKLIRKFKSVKKIKDSSFEELELVVGQKLASKIKKELKV
jgi:excinuclease ABC subunit C